VVSSSFALRFGRSLDCLVRPITEKGLENGARWVNEQNEPFVSGKKVYHWNGISDNCVHFAHNVLAALGIGSSVGVGGSLIRQAIDFTSLAWRFWKPLLAIPENDVLSRAKIGQKKLPVAEDVFFSDSQRNAFERFGALPSSEGVLLFSVAAFSDNNTVFNTGATRKFLEAPFLANRSKQFVKLLEAPAYTDLRANLEDAQKQLEDVLKRQRPLDEVVGEDRSLDTPEFRSFYAAYTEKLRSDLKALEERLQKLGE
jgi:hypothetical protein